MGPSSFCSLMQELHMCALPAPVGAVTLISSIKIIQFHWIKKKKKALLEWSRLSHLSLKHTALGWSSPGFGPAIPFWPCAYKNDILLRKKQGTDVNSQTDLSTANLLLGFSKPLAYIHVLSLLMYSDCVSMLGRGGTLYLIFVQHLTQWSLEYFGFVCFRRDPRKKYKTNKGKKKYKNERRWFCLLSDASYPKTPQVCFAEFK